MKGRISATIDDEKIKIMSKILKDGKYRNQSHFIEKAIDMLIEYEVKNEK